MNKAGFTLVEILVVVLIIGILATIAATKMTGHGEKARIVATRATIDSVRLAIDRYELELGKYPADLHELIIEGDEKWPGPFLDQEDDPKDAWGNLLAYEIRGKRVRVTSAGPDGQMATADDIWK